VNDESPTRQANDGVTGSSVEELWFATFSILDFSSVVSSSQLRRLVAAVSSLFRLTFARPK
jgi:hypothetical protein